MLSFNSKVIHKWPLFKSGDRYGFFLSVQHIFFWVSKEKKTITVSPMQILYHKLENYFSLSIYKNTYFIHIKFRFLKGK